MKFSLPRFLFAVFLGAQITCAPLWGQTVYQNVTTRGGQIVGGTFATTDTISVNPSSLTTAIKVGANTNSTSFGTISFSGLLTNAGYIGIAGGGGDNSLYFNAGDKYRFNIGGTERFNITTTGGISASIGATTTGSTDLLINPTTKTSGNLFDGQVNGSSMGKLTYNGYLTIAGRFTDSRITSDGNSGMRLGVPLEWASAVNQGSDIFFTRLAASMLKMGGAGNAVGGTLDLSVADTFKFKNLANSADAAITAGAATFSGPVVLPNYTVSGLPTASSYTYGLAWVSDATAAVGTSIGSTPTGGGSVKRLVGSDGTNWRYQ